MTALYVALTIWGGVWTAAGGWVAVKMVDGKAEISDDDCRDFVHHMMATNLALTIGICGLVAWWVS